MNVHGRWGFRSLLTFVALYRTPGASAAGTKDVRVLADLASSVQPGRFRPSTLGVLATTFSRGHDAEETMEGELCRAHAIGAGRKILNL